MKRIRIGNDFTYLWYIERNGLPEDLESATDISLIANVNGGYVNIDDFDVIGNMIRIEITPTTARMIGRYRLILRYTLEDLSNKDKDQKCTVDRLAFRIVAYTADADDVSEIQGTSDVLIGLRGKAFEYEDFTEEQLADLRQPAIDAGLIAEQQGNIAEQQGNTAESKGNTAQSQGNTAEQKGNTAEQQGNIAAQKGLTAEQQGNTAQSQGSTAEIKGIYAKEQGDYAKEKGDLVADVVDNESERVQAESERISNENSRIENEQTRSSQENIRVGNENTRIGNETDRGLAEDTRISNENTRKSNENNRLSQESTRVSQENTRLSQEGGRVSAETTRVTAESGRVTAENNRVNAESLREIAEIDRVELYGDMMQLKTDTTTAKNDANEQAQYAKDMGDYAQAQADYAKAQGEAVDGRISEVEGKIGYSLGWYGIEFDETIANSACTRIGEMDLHRRLPIQNQMRRCLLLDNGKVNYYLHKDDSTKKADGTDAILDGTDGQVMVEIPAHWRKFEKDGTVHRVKISDFKLEGFHFVSKAYRSAYEATVHRPTNKLSSVMNMSPDYRGGNNNASLDGASNSLLGRPASVISGTNFARYAKNRGDRWCMDVYHVKKTMDWLYYIEYANFNSQLPFNPTLTAEGFKQGGLGNGVTDLNDSKWNEFNGRYPFIPMGYTNSLGNKTGAKPFDMPVEYDENILTTNVPSYRGVENPFGHIWKWADGLKINIQADDAGGESQMFVCEDPLLFQHNNYEGYEMRGLLPRSNGYISKMIMGEFGELLPKEAVGGSTTYFADYFYTSLPASGESQRGVLFGGAATTGAAAGLAYSYSAYTFSLTYTSFGSRLCFIP